jgi:hypothetical protein
MKVAIPPPPISYTYSWVVASWGSCSKTCGGGMQYRDATCTRNDGIAVEASFCATSRPLTAQSCNTHSCTTTTPISGKCGNANATPTATQPSQYLCDSGTATTVWKDSFYWYWSCNGINGGTTVSCSAPYVSNPTYTYSWRTSSW